MSITGTVPVEVAKKLSDLELDAGGKKIDNLGLGDTLDDVMRRSEKTANYEVYGLLAVGLAADRPAPGIADQLYFSTDTLVLERDTGVAWLEVVRGEAAIRLAQLAERAHSSLTGIGVADHHARYTDAEAQAQAAALIVIHAAIAAAHHTKTTDAAEIVLGTFPVARGGTGLNTIALGGILYTSALDVLSRLAPTAANQVLRSTAANVLQFAALLAADIPNLDAGKITSGVFALPRIPNMDWAHISGLFPRTIAALLSDHNLAHHGLGVIVPHDALASLTEKAHTSLTGVTANQHHTKYTDAEALAAAKAGAGVLEGDLVQLDVVGLPAVDGSQLTGLPAGYTDEEAQATVKANVEVGDLKAPTKALAMNSQNITGVASLTATELHGTTYWGDVYLEDIECPVCHRKFKMGDRLIFMVNKVEEKFITAIPVHLTCDGG